MQKRIKPMLVTAGAALMLMMVAVMGCSHDNAATAAKTPNPPGSNMSPDEQVKQHLQQQGGQTSTSSNPSGTSSGQ